METIMSTSERVTLLPVDAADVTILVDNSIDVLLQSSDVAQRAAMPWDFFEREQQLIAEHGYSLLVTVEREGHQHLSSMMRGWDATRCYTIWMCWKCARTNCAPSSSRTAMPTITGVWKASSGALGGARCHCCSIPTSGATGALFSPPATCCTCLRPAMPISTTKAWTSSKSAAPRSCSTACCW